ncbi:glycosyltransferase family 2 protein, partial [Campylobacter sp. 2018MI27]
MDNNDIKVGVIIPIYNVEKYLKECINSVINQTHKNLSIILVNDGSTDNNSLNIAKEFVKLDDRIVLINKENGGLGNARNVGVNWLLQKYYLKNYIYDDKLYIYETKNQDEHNIKQIFYKNNKLKYENVDYLIFLDSDDYIKLNTIEECVKVANNNDIVWFDFEFLYDGIETQNKKTHHELYNINKSYKITANEWLDLLQDNNKNMFWFGRHGMVSL